MTVVLNHTIVRAADRDAAALFFAALLDLEVGERVGPFTPARVNEDLTLDFDQRHTVVPGHFGFLVDEPCEVATTPAESGLLGPPAGAVSPDPGRTVAPGDALFAHPPS